MIDIARDANFYVKVFCWCLYGVIAAASVIAVVGLWLDNGGNE